MNKKLLVAAVGASLAMAVGAAQADVKVGGLVHMSLDNLDRDNAADKGEWFVSNNSSFLYVHADEDLGGGMKGVAHFEFAMSALGTSSTSQADSLETSSGAVNTNRDNYVGVSGGFGMVALGNRNSPIKVAGRKTDLFYSEQLGENRAIMHQGFFDTRIANSVMYNSPSFGGWKVDVTYGTEDDYGSNNGDTNVGVSGKVGPVEIYAAYRKVDLTTNDTSGYRLGAKASFGAITVTGLYQQQNDIGGVSGRDRSSYAAAVGFKMGNSTIKAQYAKADGRDDLATSDGADQISVGFDHALSKSTIVYATYAKTSNDAAGTFGIGGNGHGESAVPGAGGDAKGFSFGIRKSF